MPDITMCMSEQCEHKIECYRYLAEPEEIQSYALFYKEDKECEYLIKINAHN